MPLKFFPRSPSNQVKDVVRSFTVLQINLRWRSDGFPHLFPLSHARQDHFQGQKAPQISPSFLLSCSWILAVPPSGVQRRPWPKSFPDVFVGNGELKGFPSRTLRSKPRSTASSPLKPPWQSYSPSLPSLPPILLDSSAITTLSLHLGDGGIERSITFPPCLFIPFFLPCCIFHNVHALQPF